MLKLKLGESSSLRLKRLRRGSRLWGSFEMGLRLCYRRGGWREEVGGGGSSVTVVGLGGPSFPKPNPTL